MNPILKKILIISLPVLAVIAGLIFFLTGNSDQPNFKTDKVARGDVIESITATGTVNAITTVQVGTQVSGTIQKLYVDYNSRVKKGQMLAQIDPTMIEAQVDQSRANLMAARANLEKAEVAVKDSKRTMERNRELFKKNLIARGDLDTAETNYESASAQVNASKASVEQAAAALKYSETNLKYTRILSPVNGIVISRAVDVGQTVAASFQTPTLFTIAEDLTKMQIDTNVNEADIGKIRERQDVIFTVDAYPEITFKGRVSQVRNSPITVSNVVTYNVVIQINNSDLKLKPGMTANATIITSKKTDVLRIPNAALRFKFSDKAQVRDDIKGAAVWVMENRSPRRVKVKTGITDGTYTELVSDNLAEGKDVIVEAMKSSKQKSSGSQGRPPRMF